MRLQQGAVHGQGNGTREEFQMMAVLPFERSKQSRTDEATLIGRLRMCSSEFEQCEESADRKARALCQKRNDALLSEQRDYTARQSYPEKMLHGPASGEVAP